MKKITIGETIERYAAFRDEIAGETFLNMFKNSKEFSNEESYVENDTYFHALLLTEMMFSNTNNSLRIFTGCDTVRFLRTLKSSFLECAKRITANKGSIKLVSLSSCKEKAEECSRAISEFFKEIKNTCPELDISGIIKIVSKENESTFQHYLVADSKMIRIEEAHPPLTEKDNTSTIKAKVYFNSPNRASRVADSFDKSFFAK